ncbi:hypothetical protein [Legionella fairfieldensis]|uniref:hypothetical protein n=1 Tax=Legionella fairfieldensis TaxID=45064 RepID=UPI001041895A|nr:hypothetical protein [Legionella fairfieldensis]
MINGIINNSSYEDITHGGYGFFICFIPPIFIFFFCFEIMNFIILFNSTPSFSEDYFMMWIILIMITSVLILFGSGIIYCFQTIQFIKFTEKVTVIRLYFFRKVVFYPEELIAISDFKINKLMSRLKTFPVDGTGFFIHLKNGKRYRVSPHMARFEELKAVLTEIAARNKE